MNFTDLEIRACKALYESQECDILYEDCLRAFLTERQIRGVVTSLLRKNVIEASYCLPSGEWIWHSNVPPEFLEPLPES